MRVVEVPIVDRLRNYLRERGPRVVRSLRVRTSIEAAVEAVLREVLIDANAHLLTVMENGEGVIGLSDDWQAARQAGTRRRCAIADVIADGLRCARDDW